MVWYMVAINQQGSRAVWLLFNSGSHWLLKVSSFLLIGHFDYFDFGFVTQSKNALPQFFLFIYLCF